MNCDSRGGALLARLLLTAAVVLSGTAVAGDVEASDLGPRLAEVVQHAATAGLPVGPLELKAREGLAKGVAEARIEVVLRELVATLEHARAVLPDGTPPQVAAAAEALRAGASDEAIRNVGRVDPETRSAALASLTDLLHLRVGEPEAVRLVVSASRRGKSGLTGLASATASLVAGGASPADAANAVSLAVAQGHAPLAAIPVGSRGPLEQLPDPSVGDSSGNSSGGGGNPGNGNNGNDGTNGNAGGGNR